MDGHNNRAIIVVMKQNKSVGRNVENVMHCWWESQVVQPMWKRVWWFLRKSNTELPYDTAIPLLGMKAGT